MDHSRYAIWVFEGFFVATVPGQGPADLVATPLAGEAHNLVHEVGVFGPVFPAEIMRQREGRILRLQIPHYILNRGVQVSRTLGILESKNDGEVVRWRICVVARENEVHFQYTSSFSTHDVPQTGSEHPARARKVHIERESDL